MDTRISDRALTERDWTGQLGRPKPQAKLWTNHTKRSIHAVAKRPPAALPVEGRAGARGWCINLPFWTQRAGARPGAIGRGAETAHSRLG